MRLTDLNAYFVRHTTGIAGINYGRPRPDGTMQWGGFEVEQMDHVDALAEAQSIFFGCPKCYAANGNSMIRTHNVLVTFAGRGVPDSQGSHNAQGEPVRWNVSGTGLNDLVCTPSILLTPPGCEWHGFIGSSGVPPGHAQ